MSFEPRSVVVLHGTPIWSSATPHPALAEHVSLYWSVRLDGPSQTVRSIPDGCTDVAFDLARNPPAAFVTGPQRRADTFEIPGRVEIFGVRFAPGRAELLLGAPVKETDRWAPLSGWIGPEAALLERMVASAATVAERVEILDAALLQRLARRAADDRLSKAIALIFESAGTAKISALAKASAASERTLTRLFVERIGLPPKRFARIVRFQHVLRRLGDKPNWTVFASELGYSDQAHMIREFKELFGCTPSEALALSSAIS